MPNTKLINCDQLQMSLEKVKTYVDGAFSKTNHNHDDRYYTESEIDETVGVINQAINAKANSTHNQPSNTITAMTGYSIGTAAAAIATSDSLNTAIGKLEYKINNVSSAGDTNFAAAKQYTDQQIAALVDTAPETLDTLNELAAALGDDPNFAATVTAELGKKSNIGHTHDVATTSADGFMSSDMVTKLNGIANNANNYSHPTTSGNRHIPSGGSTGQFLGWASDGTAQWVSNPNTDNKVATTQDAATTKLYVTGTTGAVTGGLKYNANIYFNASNNTLYATTFSGALSGKATSAGTADSATTAATASKVANSLTIQLNGSFQGEWNGSAAKTVNITPSSIGAPTVADVAKATDSEVTTMLTTIFG